MAEFFLAWFGVTGTIVTIGAAADAWLVDDVQKRLSALLRSRFRESPAKWFHSVEESFSTIFDFFYRWRNPDLDKVIWRGILFTYVGLILARVVLWLLRIPVPKMEKILVIAFVIAIGVTLMLQVDWDVLLKKKNSESISVRKLIRDRKFLWSVFLASLSAVLFTSSAIMTGSGMGVTFKNVAAISFGAGIGVPAVALLTRVKDDWIPVAPLRAIGSSLFFIGLLALIFPSAARSFVSHLQTSGLLILATVAFNIFGDALSLVETKWVLRLARGLPLLAIVGVLVMDIVLSAIIYLVLPGISNVDWPNLISAIQFRGPDPWMGLLFWSTFLTSILFYLFVISVLLVRIVGALAPFFNKLDELFTIYRPVRLVTLSMVIVETVVFIVIALVK